MVDLTYAATDIIMSVAVFIGYCCVNTNKYSINMNKRFVL